MKSSISQVRGQLHEAKTERKTPPSRIFLNFNWNFSPCFHAECICTLKLRGHIHSTLSHEIDPRLKLKTILRVMSKSESFALKFVIYSKFFVSARVKCVEAKNGLALHGPVGPSPCFGRTDSFRIRNDFVQTNQLNHNQEGEGVTSAKKILLIIIQRFETLSLFNL